METVQCAFVVIRDKVGRVVLVQEGHELAYGLWALPGGHANAGESLEAAAAREALEECGLEVKVVELLHSESMEGELYKGIVEDYGKQVALSIFLAEVVGGDLRHGEEALSAQWFAISELSGLHMRWPWLLEFLEN